MSFKVDLHITGTISENEAKQDSLFSNEELATEAQFYRLLKEGLPRFVVEMITKKQAQIMISKYEVFKMPVTKPPVPSFPPGKDVLPVDDDRFLEKFGNTTSPLPWEIKETLNDMRCSVDGCLHPKKIKGMCMKHYQHEWYKRRKTK